MKYQVTVARTGYVEIEADNEQEAMDIVANDMNSKDIEWIVKRVRNKLWLS